MVTMHFSDCKIIAVMKFESICIFHQLYNVLKKSLLCFTTVFFGDCLAVWTIILLWIYNGPFFNVKASGFNCY